MIHLGSQKTFKTRCGKSVARLWWVEAKRVEHGQHGGLSVYRKLRPLSERIDCPVCLSKIRKGER